MVRNTKALMYLTAKAIHIIGFVSWFAGLLYMVRLLIYHAESAKKEEQERQILQTQFDLMQWRLWYIISWPAMVITLSAGTGMLLILGQLDTWLHIKLGLLVGLIAYHCLCGHIRKQQKMRISKWSPYHLRVLNEGATLFLVAIVCVAVFKNALSALWGILTLLGLGVSMMIAIKLYRKVRKDS